MLSRRNDSSRYNDNNNINDNNDNNSNNNDDINIYIRPGRAYMILRKLMLNSDTNRSPDYL